MSQYAFNRISSDDFDQILAQYPETVPSKLANLEEQRLSTIPATLQERKTKGKAHLTKDEVAALVDWKLSHGTFRPSLKALVQQNSPEFVETTTSTAFSAASSSWPESLNTLVKLKGIGPATAALLLSTSNPKELPFFSDELFRWAFWADGSGSRWDRKIKYSLKEYRDLVARVDKLRARIGRGALEAEKVAYVLGKRETWLGSSVEPDEDEMAAGSVDNVPVKRNATKTTNAEKTTAASPKRKVAEDEPELERRDTGSQPTKKKRKTPVAPTSSRITRSSRSNPS